MADSVGNCPAVSFPYPNGNLGPSHEDVPSESLTSVGLMPISVSPMNVLYGYCGHEVLGRDLQIFSSTNPIISVNYENAQITMAVISSPVKVYSAA